MKGMGLIRIAGLAAAWLLATAGAGAAAPVSFAVSGVRTADGSVRVDLCTEETFLKSTCPYSAAAPALIGVTTVTVPDAPAGVYAAQIYHDRNDNHTVDRGPLGIPKEDIGFSNNPLLGLHGPSFAHAAFQHADTPQTVDIKLHHFGLRLGHKADEAEEPAAKP